MLRNPENIPPEDRQLIRLQDELTDAKEEIRRLRNQLENRPAPNESIEFATAADLVEFLCQIRKDLYPSRYPVVAEHGRPLIGFVETNNGSVRVVLRAKEDAVRNSRGLFISPYRDKFSTELLVLLGSPELDRDADWAERLEEVLFEWASALVKEVKG